MTKINNSRW